MRDGSLATLAVTPGPAVELSRLRFYFSNLTAESNRHPHARTSEPWEFSSDTPEAKPALKAGLAGFVPQPEGYVGQFSRFHAALHAGAELPVSLAAARASLEPITALYYSARTGQGVSLPVADTHPFHAGRR